MGKILAKLFGVAGSNVTAGSVITGFGVTAGSDVTIDSGAME